MPASSTTSALPPPLTIPQEFIIAILNEQTGYFHQVEGWTLNCAIIGAVLADLSLRARVDADEGSLILLDSTKTGEPVLDLCLAEIASHPGPEKTWYWIERLTVHSEDIIDTTLKHLVELKILLHHEGEFYTTNHCPWHAELQQYPESESVGDYIRSRSQKAIFTDVIPDPRDSFLIGLLNACDIIKLMRNGPQSLDRLAAKLRWNLLSIVCCQIERFSSSLSSSKSCFWCGGVRGREARKCGQAVGNALALPRGCPHGPQGSRRPEGLVHKSTAPGARPVPNVRPPARYRAIPASASHAARSRHWAPACTSAGVRPPNAECGRSAL